MNEPMIAYFSMEIGLEAAMPTYAGGLGALAGDTIRAAADLKVPMVAMTLLHRHGYFYQRLDATGRQIEEPVQWDVDDFLMKCRRGYQEACFNGFAHSFIKALLPFRDDWATIINTVFTIRAIR